MVHSRVGGTSTGRKKTSSRATRDIYIYILSLCLLWFPMGQFLHIEVPFQIDPKRQSY